MTSANGGCACGNVRYEVVGDLRAVTNCHCDPCRRITGHFMAATATTPDALTIQGEASLHWYERTPTVQYGFCSSCGSTLFWRAADHVDSISITAGSLDPPTRLTTDLALFAAEASDYHELDLSIETVPFDRGSGDG